MVRYGKKWLATYTNALLESAYKAYRDDIASGGLCGVQPVDYATYAKIVFECLQERQEELRYNK